MKLAAGILFATAAVAAEPEIVPQTAFVDFVKTYNKQYSIDEFFAKYAVFKANRETILAHNRQNLSWKMGINAFADLTWDEFRATHVGKVLQSNEPRAVRPPAASLKATDDSFDWRSKGAISPVRDQGQCGSCWAMTVVSAVESACYIATHNLTALSTQALMDCSTSVGNMGCNGGYVDESFKWIEQNPLPAESCYPYTAESGKCDAHKCPPIKLCIVTGFQDLKKGDEAGMMDPLSKQPLAVVVEADQSGWQFYTSGVMDKTCGKQLDHTALLIGYGTDSGKDYWTLQNTWGTGWGEQGYIRLIRGKDECGLADMVSWPIVKAI